MEQLLMTQHILKIQIDKSCFNCSLVFKLVLCQTETHFQVSYLIKFVVPVCNESWKESFVLVSCPVGELEIRQ